MRFQEKRFTVARTTPDVTPDECAHTTVLNVVKDPERQLETGRCWHCKARVARSPLTIDGWQRA